MQIDQPDDEWIVDACADCGADIPDQDVAFGLPDGTWLCVECATARGGELDVSEGRWIRGPEITRTYRPDV